MRVVFQIPPRFARYANDQSSFELEGQSVQDLLDGLCRDYPTLRLRLLDKTGSLYPYLTLIHNQKCLSAEEFDGIALQDGDSFDIMTRVSGG